MTLVSITGKPLERITDPTAITPEAVQAVEQPTKHEPRWFRRIREQADQRFRAIYKAFLEDMNSAQTPGTVTDKEAIRREYGHQWAAYAHSILKGAEAIPLNVNAMYEEIDRTMAEADREARRKYLFGTPLAQLKEEDLTELDLALVGESPDGTIRVCSDGWFIIHPSGMVKVWLRLPNTTEEKWYSGVVPDREPNVAFMDYRMAEFFMLLRGLRVEKTAPPTQGQLDRMKQRPKGKGLGALLSHAIPTMD